MADDFKVGDPVVSLKTHMQGHIIGLAQGFAKVQFYGPKPNNRADAVNAILTQNVKFEELRKQ